MTVVHPNHIVGINSITVQTGDSLSVHKADGSLIRTIVSNTGVSTFHAIEVSKGGGDLSVGVSTFFVDNSAGRIGIGTIGPSTASLTIARNEASGYIASFRSVHASNSAQIIIDSPADNNSRPSSIDLANAGTVKWSLGQAYASTSSGAFHVATSKLQSNEDGSKVTITTGGAVGINTVNPQQSSHPSFHLHGSQDDDARIAITTPTKPDGRIGYYGLSNRFGMDVHNGFQIRDVGDSYATRMVINSSGYMGIHNTSPATWLHINRADQQDDAHQTLKIENTSTDTAFNAGLACKNYQGTSQFMQWTQSGLRMGSRIVTNTGNGHVSITRGTDTVALTIDGASGNFTGSSSANISDGRLKENITNITSATATLKQLVGKTFNWIPEAKFDTKTKYGFIAQEVKSVIPELVYQDLSINRVSTASTAQDYGKGILIDDHSDDYSDDSKSEWSMSVETNGLVPILVEAFKELDARISALESN